MGSSGHFYNRSLAEPSILFSEKEGNGEQPQFTAVNEDCEPITDALRRQKATVMQEIYFISIAL